MKKIILSILVLLTLLLSGAIVVYAQIDLEGGYKPLAPLPGTVTGDVGSQTTNISTYVAGMIKLSIALGAALAVLFGIIGGTQYVAASINPAAKAGALERIQNSFVGLTIILSSYLVLNSINPDLVNFKLELPPVTVRHDVDVSTGSTPIDSSGCPTITTPSVILNTPEAMSLENSNGEAVLFSAASASSDVQDNLRKLREESNALILSLRNVNPGVKATVTSAYRPYNYQKHLYEIYSTWIVKGLKNNTDPTCASNKAFVKAEYEKHKLLGLVANPDTGSAPHIKGTGIDIDIDFGSSGLSLGNFSAWGYDDINKFMVHEGIYLSWQGLTNDKVHFNLRSRP